MEVIKDALFVKQFCGLLGVVKLIGDSYLGLITDITQVTDLFTEPIYLIENVHFISMQSMYADQLTEKQKDYNQQYIKMIESLLKTPNFYLCYSYDLSHTLQSLYNSGPDFFKDSFYSRVSLLDVFEKFKC